MDFIGDFHACFFGNSFKPLILWIFISGVYFPQFSCMLPQHWFFGRLITTFWTVSNSFEKKSYILYEMTPVHCLVVPSH